MPVLGQGLGHLHPQAVEAEVLRYRSSANRTAAASETRPHGHQLEGGVVELARVDGPEEVGDAEPGLLVLAGEGETLALGAAALVRLDDEVVALGVGGVVAPGHLGDEQVLGLGLSSSWRSRLRTRSLKAGSSSPFSGR